MELFFITIIGLVFRVWSLNKPEGLWNDEYVSYMISATSFKDGFISAIKSQCHMPFYYLYLKLCMAWGGQSDLLLRISSVVPGVLSIIVMYFVGLQKNKRTAIIASLMTAISSFLIYYSQEVRLYSILFLFSALSLLYFLKFNKNKSLTNLGGLILFDFLIIFTHTIGFVFVFFQLLALSVLLFREYKKQIIILWVSLLGLTALSSPVIYNIFTTKSFSQWWGNFTLSKIGFLFTDYFSPVLTNLVNAPSKLLYIESFSFFCFISITTLIAMFFIGKAVYKNKQNFIMFLIAVGTVLVMVAAAIMGKLVFITKYSIEICPILLFLAAFGAANFEKKYIGTILISIYCFINMFYLIKSPVSAPKMPRPQGHKLVAELINNANLKEGDFILTEYYAPDRFEKYFNFDKYNVVSITKGNFPEYVLRDADYSQAYEKGKEIYKPVFSEVERGFIEYRLKSEIVDKLKPDQSVLVIVNDAVAIYPQDVMEKFLKDEYIYNKIPFLFLIFSYVNNHTTTFLMSENLAVTRIEKKGIWNAIKFTKLNKLQ